MPKSILKCPRQKKAKKQLGHMISEPEIWISDLKNESFCNIQLSQNLSKIPTPLLFFQWKLIMYTLRIQKKWSRKWSPRSHYFALIQKNPSSFLLHFSTQNGFLRPRGSILGSIYVCRKLKISKLFQKLDSQLHIDKLITNNLGKTGIFSFLESGWAQLTVLGAPIWAPFSQNC